MTSRDFAYWLQGFFELNEPGKISKEQARIIQRHLGLVFTHEIDPTWSEEQRKSHDQIHGVSGYSGYSSFRGHSGISGYSC